MMMMDWLKKRLRGARPDRKLDDEMRFHLEALTEDLVAEGMSRKEARREAQRRFGNPEAVRERVREESGLLRLDEAIRNLRFAVRQLTRDPVFGLTHVLTTALIVTLGTLAWAVGDTTLWRGLPYPDAGRLVHVGIRDASATVDARNIAVDGAAWQQFRDQGPDWPKAVYSSWATGVNLSTGTGAAHVNQQRIGAGYFETLGVAPALGREFSRAEDVPDGPAVAILGHDLWTTAFGADPDILGTTIRLKGRQHTVVGVMPESFRSPADAEVWTPLRPSTRGEGGGTNYTIVARVPEGRGLDEASASLGALAPPVAWTEREGEWRFDLVGMAEFEAGQRGPTIRMLLGGIALMLLVGWANLAGLQIARTLRRRGELATRRALGGGVGALVRQLSTEMAVIGGLGGIVGVAILLGVAPLVESALGSRFGSWQPFPDSEALVVAAGAFAVVSVVVAGVWPVARVARRGGTPLRNSGGRVRGGRHIGRELLLVGQLAAVTVLVFSAGLLARSYAHLEGMEAGFDPSGIHAATFSLDDDRWASASELDALFTSTLEALERRPEVASAAVALTLPYERPLNMPIRRPGIEGNLLANVVYVTPGFFQMLDVPLLQGRMLGERDGRNDATAVLANQAFVEQYLADAEPLGTGVDIGGGIGEASIVGVVGDVQQASAGWGGAATPVWQSPTLYLSAAQTPAGLMRGVHVWFSPTWLVKGARPDDALAGVVAQVFRSTAPGLPSARSVPLSAVVDRAFAQQRLEAVFLAVMAAFAMLLAGIGLYGLVAQEVVERRGEMGVRMALGASPSGAVVRTGLSGVRLAALGLALGVALSLPAAGLLESLVFGVDARDPATLALVVGALGALALLASFVPAVRIGRLDPARILRADG